MLSYQSGALQYIRKFKLKSGLEPDVKRGLGFATVLKVMQNLAGVSAKYTGGDVVAVEFVSPSPEDANAQTSKIGNYLKGIGAID